MSLRISALAPTAATEVFRIGSDRSVYHVVPDASQSRWVVGPENDDSFREEYQTESEA